MTAATPPPQDRPAGRHSGPPAEAVGPALRAPRAAQPAGPPPPTALPPMPYRGQAAPSTTAPPAWSAVPAVAATSTATATSTSAAAAAPAAEALGAADGQALAAGRTQGDAVPAVDAALPGTQHPERTRPGRPRPRRRPWMLGPFHLLQVVVWQAAVAVVLAVHREALPVLVPVAAAAAVAVALTAVRVRGRWLYSWAALVARFRVRRRRTTLTAQGPTVAAVADALLGAVSPEARVEPVVLDDQDAGLVVHRDGVAVVLATVATTDDPTTDPARTLPPLTALLPPDESGDLPVVVQLLVQTVPAPGWTGDTDPAAVSYRQLTGGRVPARRRSWVVVQVSRLPEDDRTAELVTTLANAVRRVRRQLGRAALRTHLLGVDDLRAALVGVAGLDAGPDGAVRPQTTDGRGVEAVEAVETWGSWRAGGVGHVTYRLLDWPSLDAVPGQDLVDRLGTVSGLQTTVSVAARRTGDLVELSSSLRVRLTSGPADPTDVLAGTAAEAGARLERLDGRQRAGMAAALPLGGFLR